MKKVKTVEAFDAFDGKTFSNENDCLLYEKEIENTKKYSSYNSIEPFEDVLKENGFVESGGIICRWRKNGGNHTCNVLFDGSEICISYGNETSVNPTLAEFKNFINLLIN